MLSAAFFPDLPCASSTRVGEFPALSLGVAVRVMIEGPPGWFLGRCLEHAAWGDFQHIFLTDQRDRRRAGYLKFNSHPTHKSIRNYES